MSRHYTFMLGFVMGCAWVYVVQQIAERISES